MRPWGPQADCIRALPPRQAPMSGVHRERRQRTPTILAAVLPIITPLRERRSLFTHSLSVPLSPGNSVNTILSVIQKLST